jgi:hypothetical protein
MEEKLFEVAKRLYTHLGRMECLAGEEENCSRKYVYNAQDVYDLLLEISEGKEVLKEHERS